MFNSEDLTRSDLEWTDLKRRVNQDIVNETNNVQASDIPLHLAKRAAQCILSLLLLYYGEQRDEFQMAKNVLLHLPDIKKRWETMPQVWNRTGLPEMDDKEARNFTIEGIKEIIDCRKDTAMVVARTEEWRKRWARIDVVFDRNWQEKVKRMMKEWPHPY